MSKLGIMQPYLFPYIGYFSLIYNTEQFILFDTPQYIRKGWVNRNRIQGINGTDIFLTIPVRKMSQDTPINKIEIVNEQKWRERIFGQLTAYKKKAPYYKQTIELVKSVIERDYTYISDIAIESIIRTCDYLEMGKKISVFSEMQVPDFDIHASDEWALRITEYMKYSTYVNPEGGRAIFDRSKFEASGIELQFLSPDLSPYIQRNGRFIPGLSIIDVMMFCRVDDIKRMMLNCTMK